MLTVSAFYNITKQYMNALHFTLLAEHGLVTKSNFLHNDMVVVSKVTYQRLLTVYSAANLSVILRTFLATSKQHVRLLIYV